MLVGVGKCQWMSMGLSGSWQVSAGPAWRVAAGVGRSWQMLMVQL